MKTSSMKSSESIRKLTVTAIFAALSSVLMFVSIQIPLMPSFIKLDISELPALLASFTLGPISGIAVCFIKNIVNLFTTTTGGVGELSNFLLGACFVLPAGILYRKWPSRKTATLGALAGAALMAIASLFSNYFVIYPIYTAFIPMDAILDMYRVINPSIETLWQALIVFNLPFTFIKGLISVIVTLVIYKKISILITGNRTKQAS